MIAIDRFVLTAEVSSHRLDTVSCARIHNHRRGSDFAYERSDAGKAFAGLISALHREMEVGAIESADDDVGVIQFEDPDDVDARRWRRRGRERDRDRWTEASARLSQP